jgi:hypothetical protein
MATVADWYRDNLESGTEEGNSTLPSSMTSFSFVYESPSGDWNKTITVQGIEGEGKCLITALMMSGMAPPDDENGVDGEASE